MERRSHGKPEIPGVSGFSVGLVGLVENGRGDLGRKENGYSHWMSLVVRIAAELEADCFLRKAWWQGLGHKSLKFLFCFECFRSRFLYLLSHDERHYQIHQHLFRVPDVSCWTLLARNGPNSCGILQWEILGI